MYDGEDRITFNLMNKEGVVKLVLHMGASLKEHKNGKPVIGDPSGLIQWNSDIRGTITFATGEDIHRQENEIKDILKRWLAVEVES